MQFIHRASSIKFNMVSSSANQKRKTMEHFEHRAVIKLRANSGMTPTQTWYGLSNNNCGNACSMVIVFTGTSDL